MQGSSGRMVRIILEGLFWFILGLGVMALGLAWAIGAGS